jgi:two-component system sensor histidine kinase MprB
VSFRRRVALLAGTAVAVAIVLASGLAYVMVRAQLREQVDRSLVERAGQFDEILGRAFGGGPPGFGPGGRPPPRRGGLDSFEQLLDSGGRPFSRISDDALPIGARDVAVAAGEREATIVDATRAGRRIRLLTAPVAGGGAIQVGRSLAEVDDVLRRLRLVFALVGAGGIAAAAVLGRFVAGRATGPLRRLTETAEHVAATQDLQRRIETTTDTDEIGRLATSFNGMLDALQRSMGALDASVRAQRQLIADASHELRTPVTSLRTNIEILQANPDLPVQRRTALLNTTSAQAEELTALMNDLIDLARGDHRGEAHEPLRLDELVEEAVDRASRHAPDQRFDVHLEETTVVGAAGRLTKAVNNLLDNAVKFNAAGRPIDVRLTGGRLTVRDRGPGFGDDELEHVFDRFFRGAHTRARSGSGLGLAIVRQVAETHGGAVHAAGGAMLTLELPVA